MAEVGDCVVISVNVSHVIGEGTSEGFARAGFFPCRCFAGN
jgi:hypothetical protein